MALDRVCQKANPWSWAFVRLIQFSASWNTFHLDFALQSEWKIECIQRDKKHRDKSTHSTCTEFSRYPAVKDQLCFLQSDLGWHACSGWSCQNSGNTEVFFLSLPQCRWSNHSWFVHPKRSRRRDITKVTLYPNRLLHLFIDEVLDVLVFGSLSSRHWRIRIPFRWPIGTTMVENENNGGGLFLRFCRNGSLRTGNCFSVVNRFPMF